MSEEPEGQVLFKGTMRYSVNFNDCRGVVTNRPMAVRRSWWRRFLDWMAKP